MSTKTPKTRSWSSEHDLVLSALKRILGRGGIIVSPEVPIMGRSVDLGYVKDGILTTVEFKLHDWRRALIQARDHLLGADFSYICMPKRTISEEFRQQCTRAGVGLLFFLEKGSWPFETVIEAPRSRETWTIARSAAIDHITSTQGNDE